MTNLPDHQSPNNRSVYLWLVSAFLLVGVCAVMLMGYGFVRFQRALIYPNAVELSSNQEAGFARVLYRQGVILRTKDETLLIQDWYIKNAGFAREQIADGQCSHIYGHQQFWLVDRRMSLTICDSLNERTFYVEQTLYPDTDFKEAIDRMQALIR